MIPRQRSQRQRDRRRSPLRRRGAVLLLASLLAWAGSVGPAAAENRTSTAEWVEISDLPPDPRGGRAYRLVYRIDAPPGVCWRFKTDFSNPYLENHRYIKRHRLVRHTPAGVVTENEYTHHPGRLFRWQTRVFEAARRLEFRLINPAACGQRFHYGHIQLAPDREGTRVTHVAYFDFRGAALWALFPLRGGMRSYLRYTARWEQQAVLRLRQHYERQ